jgi:hypothetical protein
MWSPLEKSLKYAALDCRKWSVPSSEISYTIFQVGWGALNLKSTSYPDHCHHGDSPLSRNKSHGRAGNRTRDLMISSQTTRLALCQYTVKFWRNEATCFPCREKLCVETSIIGHFRPCKSTILPGHADALTPLCIPERKISQLRCSFIFQARSHG